MIEAGVVLDKTGMPVCWHVPENRNMGSLPDSRLLWDFFWQHREDISGFAHSHPGSGYPSPSGIDITTFTAIEAALGKRLDWWIITEDAVALVKWSLFGAPKQHGYATTPLETDAFPWVARLRHLSHIGGQHE